MSHEPAPYANSMPPAWCAKRRRDIQAHVNLQADATVAEQRTMLIELLSQLSSTEAQLAAAEAQATELLARATRAEAKAAGLLTELGEQEKEKLALVLDIQDMSRQIAEAHQATGNWIAECGKRTEKRKAAEKELAQAKAYGTTAALRHLIDVVWGFIYEDESVPATELADRLIAEAQASLPAPAMSPAPEPATITPFNL